MTLNGWLQISFYLAVLLLLVKPLGWYMARVYEGQPVGIERIVGPVERAIYRVAGVQPEQGMNWQNYGMSMLLFNALGFLILYLILRLQGWLPLNPMNFPSTTPDLAFNTTASFVSNTNWQAYGGETAMSYLTQMLGLTVQNFVSAATGMAVLVALIRGLRQRLTTTIGNFWVDLTRSTLYILLPLAMILALIQVSQGVIQNFNPYQSVTLVEPLVDDAGVIVTEQLLPMGPAASQIAIKQLGTNGGGFFNVNSAHPFENPTPLANFFEMIAILLLPAAFCYTFGKMVGDTKQGWALLATMTALLVIFTIGTILAEQAGNPRLVALGVDQQTSLLQSGGNMEGKEVRFGIANSALWATATTAASNGSVNSMHDSYTPLGGLVPMFLMQLGEVVFGGVGSGLYGMLAFAIIAVFVAGLMVGRTPEYLGKKIEAFEMKMAVLVILIPSMIVLLLTALALVLPDGVASMQDGGPHGFSELLYAYTSQANNNGSAFAGFNANTPFFNLTGGLAMLISRFWLALLMLAIAGSLARKKFIPTGPGTLPTHTPLFILLLCGVVLIVGGLTFIPALALGPIVEHLMLWGAY